MTFFSMFPTITYANVVVTDVTKRVVMPPSVLRQPTAFAPYTVPDGQRQDLVSYLYYGADDDDWIVLLGNQIVDPYYSWPLDYEDFVSFVIGKYGDVPTAMSRVQYWATNWASDAREITPAYYQALTDNLRKYWIPNFGNGASVLSYRRRPEDWYASTNQVMDVAVSASEPFQPGDLCTVYDTGGNFQGTGELLSVSGAALIVKDVQGTWESGWTLTTPNGTGTLSSVGTPTLFIPIDEIVYWAPVSCYDYEDDLNQQNKEVLLVQDTYRSLMYTDMAAALASPPQS